MADNTVTTGGELDRVFRSYASRRNFLRTSGLGGLAVMLPAILQACGGDRALAPTPLGAVGWTGSPETGITLNFANDFGILNYAYALEQLEAAFYTQVVATPASDLSSRELLVLTDVRDHEVAHRDFLKAALGDEALPGLTPNFSAVDFASRLSVLQTARTFEDLGVAAYNGAGKYLQNPTYLTIAGKIVSVEGRHAAAIRDLLQPRTGAFAGDDVVDANGLDRAFEPGAVLAAADPFIVEPIAVTGV